MTAPGSFLGTAAMASASAVRVAVQIVMLPIIGRILGPHAYGQVALVSPFIFFAMMLAESGLGACIVRAEKTSPELEGTIFTFSAAFSTLIVGLFAVAAGQLGEWLKEPDFPQLLIGMSSILLLAALNVVPAARLLRAKRYQWIAISDIASCLAGVGAMIAGVMLQWGVWSLIAQQVAFWVAKVAVVAMASNWWPRFVFRWRLIRENIIFSANITGSSILSFVTRNVDNLLIGAFMGSAALGYYALAFQIVGLPQMVLSGSVYYTLFAGTSAAYREGTVSATHFLKALRGVLLISAPVMVGLAVTAPLSVPFVLGDQWMPAVPLIALLAGLGLCQSIGPAIGGVLLGLGRSDLAFRQNMINSSLTVFAILVGVALKSSAIVAIGVSATSVFNLIMTLRIINRECRTNFGAIARAAGVPLIAAALMGGGVYSLHMFVPQEWPLLLRLLISIAAGVAFYVTLLVGLFREALTDDIATIKSALARIRRKA